MNILPKKSWHVRTRKNIERVKRDEAEAERLERIEQDRRLRAEQEARIRELRARAGIDVKPTDHQVEHFNLFEGHQEQQQTSNAEHDEEERQREANKLQRAGIWNKLVRSEDVNQPWYCHRLTDQSRLDAGKASGSKFDLVTSIYDPMTAIKHAEQIVKRRRVEQAKQNEVHHNKPMEKSHNQAQSHASPPKTIQSLDRKSSTSHIDSSPEIIKEVSVVDKSINKAKKKKSHRHETKRKQSSKHECHHIHRHEKHRKPRC